MSNTVGFEESEGTVIFCSRIFWNGLYQRNAETDVSHPILETYDEEHPSPNPVSL